MPDEDLERRALASQGASIVEREADRFPVEAEGLGVPFYDKCKTHTVSPSLLNYIMGEYRQLIGKPEGWKASSTEQDEVLKNTKVYRNRFKPERFVVQFPFPLPDGRISVSRFDADPDTFLPKN